MWCDRRQDSAKNYESDGFSGALMYLSGLYNFQLNGCMCGYVHVCM